MSETRYVYTLSSNGQLVQNCIRSIHSLTQYVPPEQITVFYTPPVTGRDYRELTKLGVDVRVEENETQPFSIVKDESRDDHADRNYAEKIKLCTIAADNVVFLDCDTQVGGDVRQCLNGDFDFKARPDELGVNDRWEDLFERHDRPLLDWMPNAGFLVFKNGLHSEIGEDWQRLVETDLDYTRMGIYPKEQIALALAVSQYDTETMTPQEHVIEWMDERTPDGIVYHHGAPKQIARMY